jgi:hypothetical protein
MERAQNPSYAIRDIRDRIEIAIKGEMREAPIHEVRGILVGNDQATLFPTILVDNLETLRAEHRGSSARESLIDNAIVQVLGGSSGMIALQFAVKGTMEERMCSSFRSIEEHAARSKRTSQDADLSKRLAKARNGLSDELVHSVIEGDFSFPKLTCQAGVDDGPEL